jgi:two-component system, NtrC family, response regulator GlrR
VSESRSTVSLERPRAPDALPEARLTVVHPPELGGATRISGPIALGRKADDGVVVLAHPTVSRRHVAIDARGGAFFARDLDSHNGSWLGGAPLGAGDAPLADQAVLRVGDVVLVFEEAPLGDAVRCPVSRDEVPGDAVAIERMRRDLARAAADAAPLLIVGETGTGKERIAAEAHRVSGRRGPLVSLNCAALSPQLVESQLFGHVKGAFTGAGEAQPGLFRAAERGTLFLDEVGELSAELQAKLLRAIQEREVLAVGATRPVRVDVRVVAATHRELAAAAEAGAFRRDLYARLSLWELHVPALRRRRVDVLGWIERLDALHRRERGLDGRLALTAGAAEALVLADWPLNLRAIDRLVRQFAEAGEPLRADQVPAWVRAAAAGAAGSGSAAATATATESADEAPKPPVPSREEFVAAYEKLGGSVRALARHFQRDRRQIYRWVEQYGLRDVTER